MKSYKVTEIEIKINNSTDLNLDENDKLLQLHRSSVRNYTGLPTNFSDNLGACCIWSVVLGISGTIICATIWSIVRYYT
jgi:hypothetical protein